MDNLYLNSENIDRFIIRDLPSFEIEAFYKLIKEDHEISLKIEIRESELAEEYIKGNLDKKLLNKFEKRINSDKEFAEFIAFTENLGIAAKKIEERNNLKNQLRDIRQKFEREKENGTYEPITDKKNHGAEVPIQNQFQENQNVASPTSIDVSRKIKFSRRGISDAFTNRSRVFRNSFIIISSLAALLIISLIVFNPYSEQKRINGYLAEYKTTNLNKVPILELPLSNGAERTLDSSRVNHIIDELNIIDIDNEQLKEKYFIIDNILYTHFEATNKIKIFSRINIEGQAEYFLCNGNSMFKFSKKVENKILEFVQVYDADLIKFCH